MHIKNRHMIQIKEHVPAFVSGRIYVEKIKIGKIVNAAALRGEVKVYHYSDYKERFEELSQILVAKNKQFAEYIIQNVRYQKNMVILKLKGVDDRNGAEALKDCDIYITEKDLRKLPEDTFYVKDLIGCTVYDRESSSIIGEITDVLQNSAQDIYQVKTNSGKLVLIPAVGEFIKEVNIQERSVKVSLIPGFIDNAIEA